MWSLSEKSYGLNKYISCAMRETLSTWESRKKICVLGSAARKRIHVVAFYHLPDSKHRRSKETVDSLTSVHI